ncbi:MAG: ferritin family protein [Planctomycetota bacterium]
MADRYASSEIVEMGIQIEKNGMKFYNWAADTAKSNELKDVFRFLAKQEESHIKVFSGILSEIKNYEPKEAFTDEYYSYLRLLAGDHIFTKANTGEEIAAKIHTDIDALSMAIKFEKESVLFYYEIKNLVIDDSKKAIDKLIEQEQEHFSKLSKLKEKVQKGGLL